MLTQDQAQQMLIAQNQLEQDGLQYNRLQAKMDSYEKILNEVAANYNSYSPEKRAQIDALMPQVSEQYNAIKQQKENLFLSQYEAQQQIDYLTELDAQQSAPVASTGGQRRRVIAQTQPEIIAETIGAPETAIPQASPNINFWKPYGTQNPWGWQNGAFGQNGWINYDLPGWISTANGPRYVGRSTTTTTQPTTTITTSGTALTGAGSVAAQPVQQTLPTVPVTTTPSYVGGMSTAYQTTLGHPYQTTASQPVQQTPKYVGGMSTAYQTTLGHPYQTTY